MYTVFDSDTHAQLQTHTSTVQTLPYSTVSCWHIIHILTICFLCLTPLPLVKMSCFPVRELQPPECFCFPVPAWIMNSGGLPVAKLNQAQPMNAECLSVLSCHSTYIMSRWRVRKKRNRERNISYFAH